MRSRYPEPAAWNSALARASGQSLWPRPGAWPAAPAAGVRCPELPAIRRMSGRGEPWRPSDRPRDGAWLAGRRSAMVHQGEPASTADRRTRPRGMAARTLPTVIAVSALIGLAACGSTQGNSTGPPATADRGHATQTAAAQKASAGVPLCAAAPTLDHVVVSLTAARFREILPARLTIRDAPRVQALAAALCALPPSPSGLHCPASLGGVTTAGVRGRRAGFPHGRHPGLWLPQRHRARAGPAMVVVFRLRTAAECGGRRQRPAGSLARTRAACRQRRQSGGGRQDRDGAASAPPRSAPQSCRS